MKKWLALFLLICVLAFTGCIASQVQVTQYATPVALSEEQQKPADGIWNGKGIWGGCSQLELIEFEGDYYLTANFLVSESQQMGLDGNLVTVGTYDKHTYRIVDYAVVNDMSLGKDAGVNTYGTVLESVRIRDGDSDSAIKALISQLAAAY